MVLAYKPTLPHDILSHEPPLESSLHLKQIILLLTCLEWWWRDRRDFFATGNLSIYYLPDPATRPQLPSNRKFRGPDFFVVLNTERKERSSWIVSEEGDRFPNIIVEILSKGTAKTDRTTKKDLYQTTFKTPEYFWFDPNPDKLEFQGFRLQAGTYIDILPNSQGWRWSEQLGLYLGIHNQMLRYFTADGLLVPNFEEETALQADTIVAVQLRAEQERQRAEQERQRAEQERQQKQQLVQRLKTLSPDQLMALGIDPELLQD